MQDNYDIQEHAHVSNRIFWTPVVDDGMSKHFYHLNASFSLQCKLKNQKLSIRFPSTNYNVYPTLKAHFACKPSRQNLIDKQ